MIPLDDYRITSTDQRYYACVRCRRDGGSFWNFAWHRRPYRTQVGAETACEKHRQIWERVVKLAAAKGNRLERLTRLVGLSRGHRGDLVRNAAFWRRHTHTSPDPLTCIPCWVELDDKFVKLLARARTKCLAEELKARLARS